MRRGKAVRVAIIVGAVVLVLVAINYPIGQVGCSGTDCFNFGATTPAPTGTSGNVSSVQGTILFPGSLQFVDGGSQSLSSQQSLAQQLRYGSGGRPVSSVSLSIRIQVASSPSVILNLTGWWDEVESRAASSPGGAFYRQILHTPVQLSVHTPTTIYLANLSRPASYLENMSDIGAGGKTSTTFNYALVGALNFSFSSPVSKTIPTVFAWPNLAVSASSSSTSPPGGGGGGGTGCLGPGCCKSPYICYQSILGPPAGARFAWYVLGAHPPLQLVASPTSSQQVLQELGLI